jgi:hypothetical protein
MSGRKKSLDANRYGLSERPIPWVGTDHDPQDISYIYHKPHAVVNPISRISPV